MAKEDNVENIFLKLKVNPTKIATEFGMFYDKKGNCFWFGEKKKANE